MSGSLTSDSTRLANQMTAFLNYCRIEKGLSSNSLEAYSADLSRFIEFLGHPSEPPTTEQTRLYLDHLYQSGLSTRSVARHLTTLRSFYGFLLREGAMDTDPTEHLRTPRQWQNIPKFLNLQEIDKLIEALHEVLAMPLPIEPEIGPSTLNIGLLEGGRAPNVIADQAAAHLLIRLVGPSDVIRESLLKAVGNRADVNFSLDLPFVRMRKVGDLPTMVAKFTTDIPSLDNWGEPFLLGPGSIHVAHTPNEKIAKKELLEAVDLYYNLATSLVNQ